MRSVQLAPPSGFTKLSQASPSGTVHTWMVQSDSRRRFVQDRISRSRANASIPTARRKRPASDFAIAR